MNKVLRKSLVASVLLFFSFLQVACSGGKLVKTWDGGDRPGSELAILTVPENIVLVSVDGKPMPDYLLSRITTDYSLLPGERVVELKFESVWAVARKNKESSHSQMVESELHQVRFNSVPGQRLTFRFDQPETLAQAQAMVGDFSAELIDEKGAVLASTLVVDGSGVSEQVASAATGVSASGAQSGQGGVAAMKALWSGLSAEEKQAFLSWAIK